MLLALLLLLLLLLLLSVTLLLLLFLLLLLLSGEMVDGEAHEGSATCGLKSTANFEASTNGASSRDVTTCRWKVNLK